MLITKQKTAAASVDDKKWSIKRLAKETIDNLKPFVIYALKWMDFGLCSKFHCWSKMTLTSEWCLLFHFQDH